MKHKRPRLSECVRVCVPCLRNWLIDEAANRRPLWHDWFLSDTEREPSVSAETEVVCVVPAACALPPHHYLRTRLHTQPWNFSATLTAITPNSGAFAVSDFWACVSLGPVTAPSLTCPPQHYLGTPLPGPLCREEGRHPRHIPTIHFFLLNTSSTSMATCRGGEEKKKKRSSPLKDFSFSPLLRWHL